MIKYLTIIILSIQCSFSQIDEDEKIFWSIVEGDSTEILGYTKTVHSGMINSSLDHFEENSSLIYHANRRFPNDSIIFSKEEKKYLIDKSRELISEEWVISKQNSLDIIYPKENGMNCYNYLHENKNRVLYIISKPVYFRNNELCLFFSSRLCCGSILGSTNFSIWRIDNDKWLKWISITRGAF